MTDFAAPCMKTRALVTDPVTWRMTKGPTFEGAFKIEAVQVPKLHRLVSGRRRQLAHVRAQQAFQNVVPCANSPSVQYIAPF